MLDPVNVASNLVVALPHFNTSRLMSVVASHVNAPLLTSAGTVIAPLLPAQFTFATPLTHDIAVPLSINFTYGEDVLTHFKCSELVAVSVSPLVPCHVHTPVLTPVEMAAGTACAPLPQFTCTVVPLHSIVALSSTIVRFAAASVLPPHAACHVSDAVSSQLHALPANAMGQVDDATAQSDDAPLKEHASVPEHAHVNG